MAGFLGYFSGGMSDCFLWRHLKYRIVYFFLKKIGSRFALFLIFFHTALVCVCVK